MTLGELLILIIGVLCGLFVIGIWYLVGVIFRYIFQYDVDVEHRSQDGKARLQKDFARKTKLQGKDVLQLWKNKVFLPLPSPLAIKYQLRGRKKLEIQLEEDGYTASYITTNYNTRAKDALTTEQRGVLISQAEKSAKRKMESKWRDMVVPLGFGLYAIIALVLVFAFWQELYAPVKEVQEREADMMDRIERSDQINERIINYILDLEEDRQTIKGGSGG